MKKVTKVLAVLCALAMLLVVAGCSRDEDGDNTSKNSSKSESQGADKADYNLITDGKLIMGTNAEFPPFEYFEGEEVVGVDASLMKEVAKRLGLTLEIKNMEFDSLGRGAGRQPDRSDCCRPDGRRHPFGDDGLHRGVLRCQPDDYRQGGQRDQNKGRFEGQEDRRAAGNHR